jgi:hypothetical protein
MSGRNVAEADTIKLDERKAGTKPMTFELYQLKSWRLLPITTAFPQSQLSRVDRLKQTSRLPANLCPSQDQRHRGAALVGSWRQAAVL